MKFGALGKGLKETDNSNLASCSNNTSSSGRKCGATEPSSLMSPAASGIHIKVKSNFGTRFLQSQYHYRQLPMMQVIGLPAFANCPCPKFNSNFNTTPCHEQKAGLRKVRYYPRSFAVESRRFWGPDEQRKKNPNISTKKANKSNPVQFKANDKVIL